MSTKRNSQVKSTEQLISEGQPISSNITLCSDGKYRWVYRMSLIKNPTVFLTVWKIFLFIFIGIFIVTSIVDMVEWDDFFPDRLLGNLKVFGLIFLGMTVITWVSCLIYAAKMGGAYVVLFEMDHNGVNHKQVEWQAQKARQLAALTTAVGAKTGNLTTAGIGISATRTELYTDFASVRRIKLHPWRNTINLNARPEHNQVYAANEDFEFVRDFILTHCTNAVKK